MKIENILKDLSIKLNCKINDEDINYFTEGATESIVFSIFDKYLVKTMDENTLRTQKEFLNFYNEINEFQKIVFVNEDLGYICFEFVIGEKINKNSVLEPVKIVNQIFDVVKKYKEYDSEGYGYLFEDEKSWYQFLEDEVIYASKEIDDIVSMDKVNHALEKIESKNINKYLIHGDFGTHNFLINNEKIRIIDPMPVIGDYLYDFYFAILSNVLIFNSLSSDYILSFFDRDINYKRNLFVIVLFIRMSRAFKYDKENFDIYLKKYNDF